ncbi:MAG TPA: hypothetical protein VHD83_22795 [Puia sp.]|nr:hypothetical protein [Puia sp.]
MSQLKDLLLEYHNVSKHLGPGATQTDVEKLQAKMEAISKKNAIVFWILVVMVLILFLLSLIMVWINFSDPDKIKIIFAVTGVSLTGLIVYINKFWKEKNYIDLVLIMITTLDQDKINAILNALILKL